MSREGLKKRERRSKASQLVRFLRREGKKYCAVALCASLIAGNIGNMAVAADDGTGSDYEFELDRVSLYEALQEAVAEDNTVDKDFEFAGEAADTYESLLEADGTLYELKPEIEDNHGALNLRIFARLEGEIEFDSAYEIDGSEEMIFLLTNTSDKEKTAVIRVDDKVTEQINVAPKNAVLSSEQASAYKSAAELFAGPGAMDETSAAADNGIMISGGSGSSGGGGSSGGSGGSGGGSKVEVIDESDMETESGKVDGENDEDRADDASEAEQASEAGDHKDEENQAEESHDGSETGDEADKGEGSDHTVVDSSDSGADITIDTDIDQDRGSTDVKEDSDVKVGEADQADDSDKVDSGNENSGNVDSDDAEIGDNSSDEEAADDKLAAAISYHETYLVTATPSDADEDEASPSDATDSNADKNTLDGMVYETVLMDKEAVVAFTTTFEDLNLSNLLALEASMSNAGRMHVTDLGDLTVQVWVKNGILPEDAKLQVTRLREDDETADQYQKAREALDAVGTQYSGMMALDIVFVDAEDQEIEPDGNVQVSIKMNQDVLPEDVNLESITVHHLKEEGAEIIVQSVADVTNDTTGNIDFQKSDAIVAAEFEVDSFSPFTITWEKGWSTAVLTVKYVDENGKELDCLSASDDEVSYGTEVDLMQYTYLIAGKEYKGSYLNSVNGISARYIKVERKTLRNRYYYRDSSGNWEEIDEKPTILLVYKDSTYTPSSSGEVQKLSHDKRVDKRSDGTYDLTLNISGKIGSETRKAKLDVIYVLDVSGSMDDPMSSSDKTERIKAAWDAIQSSTKAFGSNQNLDTQFALITFSGSSDYDEYGRRKSYAKTWDDAKDRLAGYKSADAIIGMRQPSCDGGTNYSAGLYEAKKLLQSKREGATTAVIFISDGNPTYRYNAEGYTAGEGTNDNELQDGTQMGKNLYAACEQAKELHTDYFYTVGVGPSDNYDKLRSLKDTATNANTRDFKAGTSSTVLNSIFDGIQSSITELKCNNVSITDALSENVKLVTKADGTQEDFIISIIDKDKRVVATGNKELNWNGHDVKLVSSYDPITKTIGLTFDPKSYELEQGYTYEIKAHIDATETAYERYRAPEQAEVPYPDVPETGTGTHADEGSGFYSNVKDKAIVTYTYNGETTSEPYAKPVIRLHPNQLIIKKTVSGLNGNEISDLEKTLGFQVELKWPNDDKSEKKIIRTYYANGNTKIADDDKEVFISSTTRKTETDVDENGNVTYVITVNNLSPNTECEITEIGREVDGYTCITNAGVSVKDKTESTEPSVNQTQTTSSVKATADKDKVISAMFTNTYSLAVTTLKVKKIVDGNMGDRDKKFTFTVSLKKGDESIDLPDTVSETGVNGYTLSTDVNTGKKCATFSLSHNGNNEIELNNLPIGSELIIKEANEDYKVKVTKGNTELEVSKTDDSASVDVLLGTTNEMVTFTNTKTAIIDAGVLLDSLPYALILGAVAAGIVFYVIRKRKEDENDLD
ncbi:MAG: VWA domain-containing protein [Lachnospiraceae bacterium]|nr:VWA domain-containing protein [Lachnospiraceae bacterium]